MLLEMLLEMASIWDFYLMILLSGNYLAIVWHLSEMHLWGKKHCIWSAS